MNKSVLARLSMIANTPTLISISHLAALADRFISNIFVIIALPMVLFFAMAVPPFEVPDEISHLFRADQISYGEILGTRVDEKNSGPH